MRGEEYLFFAFLCFYKLPKMAGQLGRRLRIARMLIEFGF
ncbi:hypothetical protein NC99_28950 [Sunxiuqinia dokdonensis]|uniref:Uncharacterized protein n=1 Tax=Sunxiuqinia dokdonensis TaxID=1409788 RepID=A0A0L8V7W9_9BACT|nr:hypothetical protein NC99_28950 [Sunxiuqinia dokdonensis]